MTFAWIFEIQVSEVPPSFRIVCLSVWVSAKDFDFKSPWKIFYASYAYVMSLLANFQSWTCDPRNIFHWRKSDFRVDFWNSSFWSFAKLQNSLTFCVGFCQGLWLQKTLENFLCVVRIRSEYVKHFPRSGESFHPGRWLTICGYLRYSRFCNYEVFQNHIYYNENLFRMTDLTKKTSIIFVFRAIFTKLQLLAKNRFWV